jgi:hypothetical protein
VAESPKLKVPHAPIFVPGTSDGYACVPNNLKEFVRVPWRTSNKPLTTKIAELS